MNFLDSIIFIDNKIENIIINLRSSVLDSFFYSITILGNWIVITVLFFGVSALFYFYKKTELILPFFVAVLGSGIMTVMIKYLVNRGRPDMSFALFTEQLPSFPSAHAALVLAFFGFLIFCIWRFTLGLKIKIFLSLIFISIIILVGFSRIYLGVHYTSDVLAGYLTGLIWLLVAMHVA